jgi:hypothetical protein
MVVRCEFGRDQSQLKEQRDMLLTRKKSVQLFSKLPSTALTGLGTGSHEAENWWARQGLPHTNEGPSTSNGVAAFHLPKVARVVA